MAGYFHISFHKNSNVGKMKMMRPCFLMALFFYILNFGPLTSNSAVGFRRVPILNSRVVRAKGGERMPKIHCKRGEM